MELATLQSAMIAAMKAKDKPRKDAISALVSAVKKAGIDAGCRDDIPTSMVDQVILKELKSCHRSPGIHPSVISEGPDTAWTQIPPAHSAHPG